MKKKLVCLCLALMFSFLAACAGSSPTTLLPGETEATEFMGQQLTPLKEQRNNALAGTQRLDRETYRLKVSGLVDTPLELTYADLQALPQVSKVLDMNCVEGWDFTAKWTGPTLKSVFEKAGVKTSANNVIFRTSDALEGGYTSLLLDYVLTNDIILGMKINDLTLPAERGFPFQVIAESKFGYKWAKWVTEIELSDDLSFKGYWESEGYSNNADDQGPPFEP